MTTGRWRRIADLIRDAGEGEQVGAAMASVATGLLGCDHVSLTVVVGGAVVSTEGSTAAASDLAVVQFELGEGPSVVAVAQGVPVTVDRAGSPDSTARWPLFALAAADRDAAAVFAFPLRVGQALIGALTAHREDAGALSAEEYANGLIIASLATVALLHEQAAPGSVHLAVTFAQGAGEHASVQVAAGMVSERLQVPIVEALVRIRAHAFALDLAVDEVARRIIDRRMELQR
jgi:GAF domain-containing protein